MTEGLLIDDPAYFERLADVGRRHWWSVGMWRIASLWLDRALAGRSGLRALDLGCGTGETARRLAARPEVGEVIGIDPSPAALRFAGRLPGNRWIRGSALGVPLADTSVDIVACFDVFQHLPPGGDRTAAAEVARVLRPGGVAVVRTNGRGFLKGGAAYRVNDLEAVIASSGLRPLRSTYANCLPALAQEVRGRWATGGDHAPHPEGGGLRIAVPAPWINSAMGVVSWVEAAAVGRFGARLPFGHSAMVLALKS